MIIELGEIRADLSTRIAGIRVHLRTLSGTWLGRCLLSDGCAPCVIREMIFRGMRISEPDRSSEDG